MRKEETVDGIQVRKVRQKLSGLVARVVVETDAEKS